MVINNAGLPLVTRVCRFLGIISFMKKGVVDEKIVILYNVTDVILYIN